MHPTSRADALAGVRVLEYAQGVAGPHCAKMLGDLGAEVIKIEPPDGGDRSRRVGPFPQGIPHPERSGLFLYLNTNKRGVTLDSGSAAGRRQLLRLVQWCDVLVESPPGARLRDLGLGYETLAARHPGLVMVSITPFGDTGPYRGYTASELVTFHSSGLGYVTPRGATDPTRPPLKAGGRLAQFFAGLNGAVAALAALLACRRTGRGQHVDVSAQECLLPMLRRDVAAYLYGGEVASRLMRSWKIAPNDIVPCRDGHVFIAAVEEAQWQRLVDLMGRPAWTADPRFQDRLSRAEHWNRLKPLIEAWTLVRSKAEICQAAQASRIPISPVNTAADLLASPHLRARGFFVEVEHPDAGPWPYPGAPYRFAVTPWRIRRPAPRLGEHNREVYGEWLGHAPGERGSAGRAPGPGRAGGPLEVRRTGARRAAGQGGCLRLTGALDGVRVVDFGHVWAGPYATALLADLGAEVIKVESETHLDVHRRQGPYAGAQPGVNRSGVWNAQNRGKLGCTLNLSVPEGGALAKRLVATSDVVVENFAPRVMTRLGLDYAALRAVRPDLIMVSLPGFGSTGPDRDHVSYGQSLIAASGIAATTGYPGGPPMSLGESYPDLAAGCHAAFAILAALHHRLETGEGQHIDISQLESSICLLPEPVLDFTMTGRIQGRAGNRDDLMAPHGCFRCRGDDRWVTIAIETDEEWEALRWAMGDPEWARSPRFAVGPGRWHHQDELERGIEAWTSERPAEEVVALLQRSGVAAGVSMTVADLLADAHLQVRAAFVEVDHLEAGPQVMYAPVWKLSDTPAAIRRAAPRLGEHNDHIFGRLLGLSADELADLVGRGIIR